MEKIIVYIESSKFSLALQSDAFLKTSGRVDFLSPVITNILFENRKKEVFKVLKHLPCTCTVELVLSGHSKMDKTKVLKNRCYLNAGRKYSKTCVKRPLKNGQNKNLNDKW